MTILQLLGIVAALGTGFAVYRANPARSINRAFLVLSATVTLWQLCLVGIKSDNPGVVLWLRLASAVGAVFPWTLWLLKECVQGDPFQFQTIRKSWMWLLAAAAIATLCFTRYFIPPDSTSAHPLVGWAWPAYSFFLGAEYILLLVQTAMALRASQGISRIELQMLLIGGTSVGLFGLAFLALGPAMHLDLRGQLPSLIVAFYTGTAWAITTHKVFDARQLFGALLEVGIAIACVAVIFAFGLSFGLRFLSAPVVIVVCATLATLLIQRVHFKRAMRLVGQGNTEMIRSRLLKTARESMNSETLEERFRETLSIWAQTEHSYIFIASNGGFAAHDLLEPLTGSAKEELEEGGWVTPEKLARQTLSVQRSELLEYLRRHRLAAMVAGPRGSGSQPVVIALEMRHDRRPFTFVDVEQMKEWAAIVEGALSRVSLMQQARDSEQLATAGLLGASLAHEIRNPLVTIKSVVFAAKKRFDDPGFKRLLIDVVPGEIERIENLVEGLMDLGKPRLPHFENINLNALVEDSVKLVRPKAKEDMVEVVMEMHAHADEAFADASSIRQVVLNLTMNAISAVSTNREKREVTIRSNNADNAFVLEVSDNGPGVPPEVRQTLFRPFSKSTKTSGIGLGLAICADIVRAHSGQIVLVDDARPGTTFRITLPCLSPSS